MGYVILTRTCSRNPRSRKRQSSSWRDGGRRETTRHGETETEGGEQSSALRRKAKAVSRLVNPNGDRRRRRGDKATDPPSNLSGFTTLPVKQSRCYAVTLLLSTLPSLLLLVSAPRRQQREERVGRVGKRHGSGSVRRDVRREIGTDPGRVYACGE